MQRQTTNEELHVDIIMKSSNFKFCCKAAKIEPTRRQAIKWINGKGQAWAINEGFSNGPRRTS